MKLLQRGVALALLTTFTLASETALAYEQDKTYKITVLHTNDHHGHFWRNEYGEYGLAAQKTLVDGIRKEVAAEGGSVLLLSGGDINTGVPESDLQDAEPDFRGNRHHWHLRLGRNRSECSSTRPSHQGYCGNNHV